jgi:hypothetical protein
MEDLANELLLHIMSYCSPAQLAALAATSHRIASLALDDPLWRRLYEEHFAAPRPAAYGQLPMRDTPIVDPRLGAARRRARESRSGGAWALASARVVRASVPIGWVTCNPQWLRASGESVEDWVAGGDDWAASHALCADGEGTLPHHYTR